MSSDNLFYQSAQIAIDTDDIERIACVDTKHVAAGRYMVVAETAKAIKAHPEWTLSEAKEAAEKISASVHMCFIPDTLKFLRAGGRVSNGAAIAGELLKSCIHRLRFWMDICRQRRSIVAK